MLVGIMTMHRVPNYGSFLQAYSLKKMIESLGHDVVFVDFRVEPDIEHRGDAVERIRCGVRRFKKDLKATALGHVVKHVVRREDLTSRSTMFGCDRLLGVTDKYRYRTKCDVLVIGSDEVFNCLQLGPNVGYSLELFGRHANAARIVSYAASFGNTTLEKLKHYGVAEEISGLLKDFDALSVRDRNSASVVEELTSIVPQIHLDPVLVSGIENATWADGPNDGFIILYGYSFRFTEEECSAAMAFAHSRGLKLVAVGEDQILRDEHIRCRPDQVLPYFKSAEYVVTDTFHGTIFSAVSHTPFVTIPRGDKNGQGGNIQKLTSLLDGIGLADRRIESIDGIESVLTSKIDFSYSDEIRRKEAQRSMNYLQRCFG